jgi:hypothetical protein
MSVIGDLVSKCCDLSVGAVALAFGDPSGGQLAASALGGLTSIGVGMWVSCEERTRDRAMNRTLANLRKSGAFTEDALKDAATLLGDKQTCLIDPARLSSLATEQNMAKGGAEYLVSQMQPAPDPGTADILRVALQAGIETCLEDQAFLQKLTFEFVRDIARGQGVELEILKAIQTRVDQIVEKVDGMSRAELNELAETWGIDDAPTMGLLALKSRLLETAQDAQRVSRQIANLEGLSDRIDNIRAAAADAVDRMALDEARNLIRDARQVHREEKLLEPLKQDALLAEQEAEIELLDHRPEQAYALLIIPLPSHSEIKARALPGLQVRRSWRKR